MPCMSGLSVSECILGKPAHERNPADKGGLVIFDWDDTILPTSWLRASGMSWNLVRFSMILVQRILETDLINFCV